MTDSNPYVLGVQVTAEGERLLKQCRGLEREARWLLDRIGVRPGWRVVDVGCGPFGVLDLLAERGGPSGEVVGLEREARFVALGETMLKQRDLQNARFAVGDAYAPGLPPGVFDFAHARLLLINLTDPTRALAEMVALARQRTGTIDRAPLADVAPQRWASRCGSGGPRTRRPSRCVSP